DSLIFTQTFLIPSDSTFLFQTTCDSTMAGTNVQVFISNAACDSVVITEVLFQLSDTTMIQIPACMFADTGTSSTLYLNTMGCDSLVIVHNFFAGGDTTELFSVTCSPQDSGMLIFPLINQYGCDSIIVSHISYEGSDTLFQFNTTCDSSQLGLFVQTLINQNGCDSIVVTNYDYALVDSTYLFDETCLPSEVGTFVDQYINQFGCDSIVTRRVTLQNSDTTVIILETCDPNLVGTDQLSLINQHGCDSIVFEVTALYPLAELQIITSDYNGYDISCYGENDGSALVNVIGVSPYSYSWSNGSSEEEITGLVSGNYSVTVTDGNGCMSSSEIILLEPHPLMITFLVSQPDCFIQDNGSIIINPAGGVIPIKYSINAGGYQLSPVFNGLRGGIYEISAIDANNCEVKEIIGINVPAQVNVDLGDDQVIDLGDTVILNAIINVPFDSLASMDWSGLITPDCPICPIQKVIPIITTTYSVSVITNEGCRDEDSITLFVEKNVDIYIPNIFSPNGDNVNDKLVISAGSDVEEISSFIIYDRWGNMVFAVNDFLSDDLNSAWDGKVKGKQVNPGVFVYKIIVNFKDGRSEIRYGDVTLVR
ncbi:MAG TPA: gliding motility-associated C-terminal domain-containing protein, partial [Saprospiraceae bacterium]|nr:gliding motility-associated C-terminal domain-containing protein [Saprospiraceae bacterium]